MDKTQIDEKEKIKSQINWNQRRGTKTGNDQRKQIAGKHDESGSFFEKKEGENQSTGKTIVRRELHVQTEHQKCAQICVRKVRKGEENDSQETRFFEEKRKSSDFAQAEAAVKKENQNSESGSSNQNDEKV